MKKNIFYILFLLFFIKIQAQQKFNLKDCVSYGLEHHPSVQIYKNKGLAANAAVKEVLSSYLPSINLNAILDDNLKVQKQIILAKRFLEEHLSLRMIKENLCRLPFSWRSNTFCKLHRGFTTSIT